MRKPFVLSALVISLALASAPLMGCGGANVETPAANAGGGTRAPIAQNSQGHIKLIGLALGDVPLRPNQRTEIEKLAGEADARAAAGKQAHVDVMLAVADQVEKGQIDRAALKPKVDAAVAVFEKNRPAEKAALEKLHGILDADQRVQFVNALEAKLSEHRSGGMREHMAKGKGMNPMGWARDLNLTDDQKKQLHEAMRGKHGGGHDGDKGDKGEHHRGPRGPRGEHGEHGKAGEHGPRGPQKMFEAFKSDHFVADEVSPGGKGPGPEKFVEGMLGFVEIAVPILTPEQRTVAANKLREHAKAN